MSRENVARFLEANEAFKRGDLEAWLGFYDAECVFEPQIAEFEGIFTGQDGLRRFFASIGENLESFQPEFDDVRDIDDRVVALGTGRVRGRESGVEGDLRLAIIASFREGKIVHFKDYGDRDKALEAAGLSE
jgi:ketosteroid isomerase-like protein